MDLGTPKQNLIKQIPAERIIRPPGFYKSIVFDVCTVLSAAALGYVYSLYLQNKATPLVFGSVIAVFGIFSALQVFLTKNFARRFSILVLEAFVFIPFFFDYSFELLVAVVFFFLVFATLGEVASRRAMDNSLQVRFLAVARPVLTRLTTGIVLILILLYIPQWNPESIFLSENAFQGFFDSAAGGANKFYPEVMFSGSFKELAESLARLQLAGTSVFLSLSPASQEQVVRQTASQIIESVSKNLGVEVSGGESTSKIFYNLIIATLRGFHDRFGQWFLVGWAVAVFFVARGFGTIFYWAVGLCAFIVYELLLAIDFIRITGESRTHEVVEFT
ncbi:hypothetical protein C4571_03665 [Candidatus Parcubacteria bacterium]|nr:MAG: hypothetical protein C4571_03665 [Candidatus Parcubacteria bacterium]